MSDNMSSLWKVPDLFWASPLIRQLQSKQTPLKGRCIIASLCTYDGNGDVDGDEEEEDGSSSLETDARSSRDNVLSVEDMMKFRLA